MKSISALMSLQLALLVWICICRSVLGRIGTPEVDVTALSSDKLALLRDVFEAGSQLKRMADQQVLLVESYQDDQQVIHQLEDSVKGGFSALLHPPLTLAIGRIQQHAHLLDPLLAAGVISTLFQPEECFPFQSVQDIVDSRQTHLKFYGQFFQRRDAQQLFIQQLQCG